MVAADRQSDRRSVAAFVATAVSVAISCNHGWQVMAQVSLGETGSTH